MAGEFDFKRTTGLARSILDADFSVQLLDERVHDVQPQSGSLLPSCQLAPRSKEHAKNPIAQFMGNPLAVVHDTNDRSTSFADSDMDFNPRGIARVLDRIVEQVAEHGFENQRSGKDDCRLEIISDRF